eukprot:4106858-Amphidinium_carterae.1
MTREERRQVLGEVLGELDEEMRRIWEPVLTPMGNLLWVNKIENYSQFRTPRFVHIMPKEPLPDVEPVAATTSVIPVPPSTVVKFTTSKPAKACLKKIVDDVGESTAEPTADDEGTKRLKVEESTEDKPDWYKRNQEESKAWNERQERLHKEQEDKRAEDLQGLERRLPDKSHKIPLPRNTSVVYEDTASMSQASYVRLMIRAPMTLLAIRVLLEQSATVRAAQVGSIRHRSDTCTWHYSTQFSYRSLEARCKMTLHRKVSMSFHYCSLLLLGETDQESLRDFEKKQHTAM